jgi:hypothetical protein
MGKVQNPGASLDDINVTFSSTGYGPLWAPAVSSWLRAVGYASRHFTVNHLGKIGGAGVTDRTYTHMAENQLVKDSLADPLVTHIFMTEMDMILPDDCLVKLVEMDKDIATGIYFLRSNDPNRRGQPCLYKRPLMSMSEKSKEGNYGHAPVTLFPTDEPFRIDCAGLGCILMKRKVFEILPEPWFDLNAKKFGSDIYFAKHAKDAGIETWANPKVLCGQIDYYETDINDWRWQLDNNPEFVKHGWIIGKEECTQI